MTIAAAIHTSVAAAYYSGGFLTNKVKEALTKPKEVEPEAPDLPVAKNQRQVMASIGKLRTDLMSAENRFNRGFGFAGKIPKK